MRKSVLHEWSSSRKEHNLISPEGHMVVGVGRNIGHKVVGLDTENEADIAHSLGLDLATYRMLRQLEQREIVPEDYDLLGRLDESVKPTTLSMEDLQGFPTKKHCAHACRDA